MTVRVGVVGCGFIARYHAAQLRWARQGTPPQPNVIAVVHDIDAQRAAAFAEDEGARVAEDLDDLLASVDAVVVCTWTSAHLPVVAAVADAGLPVFCEKPLGVDLVDARAVAAAATRCPVDAVGLVLRDSPALLAVRELVCDPAAGRLMSVVFRDDQYLPTQGMYASVWRADASRAGSGTMLEHSIHDVDLLEWLGGPVERLAAQHAHFHGIEGIEDSVGVLGRFASGASFTLSSVWHDVLDRPSQRRIELFCERRLVTLEGDVVGPVQLHADDERLDLRGDELVEWLADRGVVPLSAEARFLAAVAAHLAGEPVEAFTPDAAVALRAHVVVDAVYRSAGTGGELVVVSPPLGS